jgi:hypothetical protein
MLMDTAEDNPGRQARVAAFRQQLKELGWVEGSNLHIELRWGGGDVDRVRRDAAELVGLSPNVLFAYANAELRPLSQLTHTIPIIFVGASAPVEDGYVASLAHPGGNITGITQYEPSMASKWLSALKEISPRIARVALLVNPDTRPTKARAICVRSKLAGHDCGRHHLSLHGAAPQGPRGRRCAGQARHGAKRERRFFAVIDCDNRIERGHAQERRATSPGATRGTPRRGSPRRAASARARCAIRSATVRTRRSR